MIREIHRKLVEGVRGGSAAPGEYRRIQNYVVNSVSKKVIYTPPTAVDFEALCPESSRRSLQRDLKALLDKKIVETEGATNQLAYTLVV